MIFMVPKSHNSHVFHHDPPDCLCQSSTLIKPSKSSSRDSAYFFRARQFWIGQLSRALPIGLGGLKLRNSSCFGAGCDTMAFDKATESTLDSPSACGSGVGRGDIKGFLREFLFYLMFAWCLKSSKMVWIECRQGIWIFKFEPGSRSQTCHT